ncbi:MAG: DUF1080 domain-containing protein [Acidobacteria bacterium]|nr:DUF1080 domain-containing protein [Acidobacteriota bacterium]
MNMRRGLVAALALMAAPLLAEAGDFNGRWNITVEKEPRGRAWWLEVEAAGTRAMRGKFVGAPGGQMDVIPEMRVEGEELVWVFERGGKKLIYRAKTTTAGTIEGAFQREGETEALKFVGRRAPVMRDKDDGTWVPGKPVELFNGKDMTGWVPRFPGRPMEWFVENGVMKNKPRASDIATTAKFGNFKLHLEFKVAQKSNSGVGLRARYEVQIYGDYGEPPSMHGNGALYSRVIPKINATLPPDQWQTYDITFIGRELTVVLNGKTLHDHIEVEGLTAMATDADEAAPGPLALQGDHGPVEFRKITLTPMVKKK